MFSELVSDFLKQCDERPNIDEYVKESVDSDNEIDFSEYDTCEDCYKDDDEDDLSYNIDDGYDDYKYEEEDDEDGEEDDDEDNIFKTEFSKDELCKECTDEEWNTSKKILESFLETVRISTIKIGKNQKRKAYAGLLSLGTAKKRNDPAYKRYKMFRARALEMKRKIMKKYNRSSIRTAKRNMR
jgi:hypothetical protein